MILESLDLVNIKDLSIKEPQERLFDPSLDLTDKDWKEIAFRLKDTRTAENLGSFGIKLYLEVASIIPAIASDRVGDFSVSEEIWQICRDRLNKNPLDSSLEVAMRAIYPDRFPETISEGHWLALKRNLAKTSTYYHLEHLANMKILDPMLFKELEGDGSSWKLGQDYLERDHSSAGAEDIMGELALLRIAFTERFTEFKNRFEDINSFSYQIFRDLDMYRADNFDDAEAFLENLYTFKVLQASELRFKNSGLKLIIPETETFTQPGLDLPLRRAF